MRSWLRHKVRMLGFAMVIPAKHRVSVANVL